jgi:aspartate kinase
MIIRKFGGTSVGSVEMMKQVANIINDGQKQVVVVSALSGITNWLENISGFLQIKDIEEFNKSINRMQNHYHEFVDQLFATDVSKDDAKKFIEVRMDYLRGFSTRMYSFLQEKALLSDGEIMSSYLFYLFLKEQNLDVKLLSALDFMRIDKDLEPDSYYIRENILRQVKGVEAHIYLTQGYICRNAYGEIDNLKRGGSDYSATLIGAALQSDLIEIWTDIDGVHNNDPRFVANTQPIRELSFDEAAELAYFGAKILHPASLQPARKSEISVQLKNTMEPSAEGTLISSNYANSGIKAVAAKDAITAIRIKSARMLNAYGFLRKVFEVFEVYKTSIDMITTSEVAISVTIDDNKYLDDIIRDLNLFCEVEVDRDQTIIAVVGIMKSDKKGYAALLFDALKNIPVKMISYGASDFNISLLINSEYKIEALNTIQSEILSVK